MKAREEFDLETLRMLDPFDVDAIAYGGYMSIVTTPLVKAYVGVNVHPADLRVIVDGQRKYTGHAAVGKAIVNKEPVLRSCTHLVTEELDGGPLLLISEGISVEYPAGFDPNDTDLVQRLADQYQTKLKEKGDWIIFPKTIEYIARGRFEQDVQGRMCFDGAQVLEGREV